MDENINIPDGKIPLGLCKQVCMKLESVLVDLHEILEDPDVEGDDRDTFEQMTEMCAMIMAATTNIVMKEMEEEEFISISIPIDDIDDYPGDEIDTDTDILDQEI